MNKKHFLKIYSDFLQERSTPGAPSSRSHRRMHKALLEFPVYTGFIDKFNHLDKIMVWSDLHIGHENIIKYTDRPFSNEEEMTKTLFDNMYYEMDDYSTMIIVGDLAMRKGLCDYTWNELDSLPRKDSHLILGNHDLTDAGKCRIKGIDNYWSMMVTPGDPDIVWSHYPLPELPDGWVNIHGHQHNSPVTETRHINVSVEHLDYKPISMDKLYKLAGRINAGIFPKGKTTLERIENL